MKKIGTKILSTERITLRPFEIDDTTNVFNNFASDPEANKFLRWPTNLTLDDVHELISNWISNYDNDTYNWAIALNDTKEVIGNIAVINMYKNKNQVEIAFVLGNKYHGKGITSEILKTVNNFLTEEAKVNKVILKIDTNDALAIQAAIDANMIFCKTCRTKGRNNQGICSLDSYEYIAPLN